MNKQIEKGEYVRTEYGYILKKHNCRACRNYRSNTKWHKYDIW